jgi:hypothetical protein
MNSSGGAWGMALGTATAMATVEANGCMCGSERQLGPALDGHRADRDDQPSESRNPIDGSRGSGRPGRAHRTGGLVVRSAGAVLLKGQPEGINQGWWEWLPRGKASRRSASEKRERENQVPAITARALATHKDEEVARPVTARTGPWPSAGVPSGVPAPPGPLTANRPPGAWGWSAGCSWWAPVVSEKPWPGGRLPGPPEDGWIVDVADLL